MVMVGSPKTNVSKRYPYHYLIALVTDYSVFNKYVKLRKCFLEIGITTKILYICIYFDMVALFSTKTTSMGALARVLWLFKPKCLDQTLSISRHARSHVTFSSIFGHVHPYSLLFLVNLCKPKWGRHSYPNQ